MSELQCSVIDGWDKGPRDRTKKAVQVDRSADWIYRLGPEVVIEVMDLNGSKGESLDANVGVMYADLVIGEGSGAHRMPLGPVLYGNVELKDDVDYVETRSQGLHEQERRGREAAAFILTRLGELE